MGMGLYGLEESPYSGWTLTNMTQCGHRLLLGGCQVHEMNSLTGWTQLTTPYTVNQGRLKATLSGGDRCDSRAPTSVFTFSGNFDLRLDYEVVKDAGSTGVLQFLWQDTNGDYVSLKNTGGVMQQIYTGGAQDGSDGSYATRHGTLRIKRATNTFTTYYWSQFTQDWVQVASASHAFSTTGHADGQVYVAAIASSALTVFYDSLRMVYPTQTSGSAESPVFDTVDGLRGIWWQTIPGTGSVTVEYRYGTSSGACSAAAYSAATAGAVITPSAANRFVQVKVSVSGGSTSAASPEIGPVLINGSLDASAAQLVTTRLWAKMVRNTDSSYRLGINEEPSSNTSVWHYAGCGIGKYKGSGGSDTVSWQSTSFDIAANWINGTERLRLDGGMSYIPGSVILPSLLYGGSALYGNTALTGTMKGNWVTAIEAGFGGESSDNQYAFEMSDKGTLTALDAADTGNWDTFVNADLTTPWTTMQNSYYGAGAYADGGIHYDVYSLDVFTPNVAVFRYYWGAGFTYNTDVVERVKACFFNSWQMLGEDGYGAQHGRSCGITSIDHANALFVVAQAFADSSAYAIAREAAGRSLWELLTQNYVHGHDVCTLALATTGDEDSFGTATTKSVGVTLVAGRMGTFAWDDTVFDQRASGVVDEAAWAWEEAGYAWLKPAGHPARYFHARDTDVGADRGKYQPGIVCGPFAQNTGFDATNKQPSLWTGSIWVSTAAGNTCTLQQGSTTKILHCGKAVISWRTGTSLEWSASAEGTATGPTITEWHLLYQHHIVAGAKVGATVLSCGYATPPIPLPSGTNLSSSSSSDSPAQGYGESVDGSISAFIIDVAGSMNDGRVNTDFIGGSAKHNRRHQSGLAPDVRQSGTLTGTNYHCVDMALARGSMTPATEAGFVDNYSRSSDVVKFTADALGDPADVCLCFTAQNFSGEAVGLWAVTGATVHGFVGASDGSRGGGDLGSLDYNGSPVLELATDGNVSFSIESATKSRFWYDGQSDLTLYPAALPTDFATVYAIDWNGSRADITAGCTITPGTSIVVPDTAVADYAARGMVVLEVEPPAFAPPIVRRVTRFFIRR